MDESLVQDAYRVKAEYVFEFEDDSSVSFKVDSDLLEPKTNALGKTFYRWAALEKHKCDHCPLDKEDFPLCPAAANIQDIVEYFAANTSCNLKKCTVNLPGKTITARKPLQACLSALIGLRMATSACPTLSQFRLMARFHDPFNSPYETVYRTCSAHLLKQYFRMMRGEQPDFNFSELKAFWETIGRINIKMTDRLKEAGTEDCGSLQVLSVFSVTMTWLFEDHLKILEKLTN